MRGGGHGQTVASGRAAPRRSRWRRLPRVRGRPRRRAGARRPRGTGRRRRVRDQQRDALPRRLPAAARRATGRRSGPDRVVTSARASAIYLRDEMPEVRRVLAVGASGLERELREAGLDVVTAAHAATRMSQEGIDGWAAAGHPDAVVVGLDPQLTYLRVAAAADCVRAGCGARGDEPGPDLSDRARVSARGGIGGGGDRGRLADDGPGHHRQARVPTFSRRRRSSSARTCGPR